MKAIISIGGGEIRNQSTLKIDKAIASFLINNNKKKVLFLPTASNDNENYIQTFKSYYESLNLKITTLCLSIIDNDEIIKSKIFASDAIYIGGGNSAKLMRVFKRTHLNEYLKMAYEKGIVIIGISSGAMVLFESGYSDANKSTNINAKLSLLKCINIIPYCFCPHFDDENRKDFSSFLKEQKLNGIALDSNASMWYINDKIQGVLASDENKSGYIFIDSNKKEIAKF
ncbi:MAG: peptidase E [Erysipelotrichaceae bacterium]|nr:peptidase E [Erysipelotrichaceae bacterium]